MQDAFVSAWRRLPRVPGAVGLRTWLHRIVVNRCLNMLRSRRPVTDLEQRSNRRRRTTPPPAPRRRVPRRRGGALGRSLADLSPEQAGLLGAQRAGGPVVRDDRGGDGRDQPGGCPRPGVPRTTLPDGGDDRMAMNSGAGAARHRSPARRRGRARRGRAAGLRAAAVRGVGGRRGHGGRRGRRSGPGPAPAVPARTARRPCGSWTCSAPRCAGRAAAGSRSGTRGR